MRTISSAPIARVDGVFNAVVAIGKLGDRDALPDALKAREVPSQRKTLSEIVSADRFSVP